ncbi:hypothetical protein LINGRAHAP2_LOCUS2929 [Linum grandiflorum]
MSYGLRKRVFGDKGQEFNGSKQGIATPVFSTPQPSSDVSETPLLGCRMTRGTGL